MSHQVNHYYFSFVKKLFDLSFGLLILFLIFPVLLTISLIILLTIGWPVIFVQKRTGKDNKSFLMYKFRTMYVAAHREQVKLKQLNQAPGPMFKIFDDPRYVGVGKILSRTGLDELPQIFNIIKGEMSLVGPRPLPIAEAKELSFAWEFRKQVKPGVFSEWTLANDRHDSLKNWRDLDRETLSNGGIFYDLKLIILTLIKSFKVRV